MEGAAGSVADNVTAVEPKAAVEDKVKSETTPSNEGFCKVRRLGGRGDGRLMRLIPSAV